MLTYQKLLANIVEQPLRRSEMNICIGESVAVNVAAFTGSRVRSKEAIPCEVLEVEAGRLLVKTTEPYRILTMWVSREWIEDAACLTEPVCG
jgi:hypothetical protein